MFGESASTGNYFAWNLPLDICVLEKGGGMQLTAKKFLRHHPNPGFQGRGAMPLGFLRDNGVNPSASRARPVDMRRTAKVEYEKSREGITCAGILAHMASGIMLWRSGAGTQNDCQLGLNFLLRGYHRRMLEEGLYGEIPSTPAARRAMRDGDAFHLEHAIPIASIMWALLNEVTSAVLVDAVEQARKVVESTMFVAYVSTLEHRDLNKKFACHMPAPQVEYPWSDVWARYTKAGVPIPEVAAACS